MIIIKRVDYTGQFFGKLLVIGMKYSFQPDNTSKPRTYCECLCECGNTVFKLPENLKRNENNTQSCGCEKTNILKSHFTSVVGNKYGRLKVLEEDNTTSPHMLKCQCDCGNVKIISKLSVVNKQTISCGCYRKERTTECNTNDLTGYISPYGVKAIQPKYKNKYGQWIWEFECPLCHNLFDMLPAKIKNGHTSSCGCRKQSKGEKAIQKILIKNNLHYIPQYSFPDCKNEYVLKFDFAIVDQNSTVLFVIEYDGEQHYKPIEWYGGINGFKNTVKRDLIKNQYCKNHNIPLIRIKYDTENDEIEKIITNTINP